MVTASFSLLCWGPWRCADFVAYLCWLACLLSRLFNTWYVSSFTPCPSPALLCLLPSSWVTHLVGTNIKHSYKCDSVIIISSFAAAHRVAMDTSLPLTAPQLRVQCNWLQSWPFYFGFLLMILVTYKVQRLVRIGGRISILATSNGSIIKRGSNLQEKNSNERLISSQIITVVIWL